MSGRKATQESSIEVALYEFQATTETRQSFASNSTFYKGRQRPFWSSGRERDRDRSQRGRVSTCGSQQSRTQDINFG